MPSVQGKVCILGDFGVGKTSLVRRYVEGIFHNDYLSTIGVKVSRHVAHAGGTQVNLIIWDVAGGEESSGVHTNYLKGATAALLVCDMTRASSLSGLQKYANAMQKIEPSASFVVVGNKYDLKDYFEITEGDVSTFARGIASPYLITSAKTGQRVEDAFTQIAIGIQS